jgi:catechol 2,3-dioxygenase
MALWLTHVGVRVPNLQDSIEFHTSVLGLTVLSRESDRAYLSCGYDRSVDLCLVTGGTGLDHVAFGVTDERELDTIASRLLDHGAELVPSASPEPGVNKATRLRLPSGHLLEFVIIEPDPEQRFTYPHPAAPPITHRSVVLLIDLDHVTLRHTDVSGLALFLQNSLGFHIPDARLMPDGQWRAAWLHVTSQHHDLAIIRGDAGETLDHVAFRVSGIETMKYLADRLASFGMTIEVGPGRHSIGGNLFTYFWTPDGNRYELSAEMAMVSNTASPTRFWGDDPGLFSPWGIRPPESFRKGS